MDAAASTAQIDTTVHIPLMSSLLLKQLAVSGSSIKLRAVAIDSFIIEQARVAIHPQNGGL
jgi:hypothetical protein